MRKLFLLAGRSESDALKTVGDIPSRNLVYKSLFTDSVKYSKSRVSSQNGLPGALLSGFLKSRFSDGETVFLTSDHIINDAPAWIKLASSYEYEVLMVLSPNLSKKSSNKLRALSTKLGVSVVDASFVTDFRFTEVEDLSEFGSVLVVGDVHGCVKQLKSLFEIASDFQVGHTIFLGDLFDRGPDNVEVFNLVNKQVNSGKATLIRGNHEDHIAEILLRHSLNFSATQRTLKQFKSAGISNKKILNLTKNTIAFKAFSMFGREYWASHGGASSDIKVLNEKLDVGFLSEKYFMYGESAPTGIRGVKGHAIDKILHQHYAETGISHLHGHRNASMDVVANQGVFNLESDVDSGGFLSGVVIHSGGETVLQVSS